MTAVVTPIRASERSPARQALATAIAEMHDLECEIKDAEAAKQNWFSHKITARDRLETAEADLAAVIAKSTDRLVASLAGKELPAPISTLEARAALQDAQDALTALDNVHAELESRCGRLDQALKMKLLRVRSLVIDSMRADETIQARVKEFSELERLYHRKRAVINWLRVRGIIPEGHSLFLTAAEASGLEQQGQSPWNSALDLLHRNPDAPLPVE